MKPTVPQAASDSVEAQLDAQSREIAQLKAIFITSDSSKDAVAANLRSQVSAQQVDIEHLTEIAAANKETADASTEHLQAQVDSIQQEVEVLSQTVASQATAIGEVRAVSEPPELQHAYAEYLKASAEDLGGQLRQEQETHADTRQQLAEMAEILSTVTTDQGEKDQRAPLSRPE